MDMTANFVPEELKNTFWVPKINMSPQLQLILEQFPVALPIHFIRTKVKTRFS